MGTIRKARLSTLGPFGDPEIRPVLATIGGDDQITVVPHLDRDRITSDPKSFLGYSDNTNLLSWLWNHGITSFYGGSTQVNLGAGTGIDAIHRAALRAALLTGERLEVTDPGESEDFGVDWPDPAALTQNGQREDTEAWTWAGAARTVTGRSWGGCIEVIQQILMAGRFPTNPEVLRGGVLLLETSEEIIPADDFRRLVRTLGERGVLAAVDAVLLARPPASDQQSRPPADQRAGYRAEQRDVAIELMAHYNPDAVVCVGVPFGHTRPQWILPYGGEITVDGTNRQIFAHYR